MTTTTSPNALARAIAILMLLTVAGGIFAQAFVSERLIDFASSAATAVNVSGNRGLFHAGFAAYLIEMTCQIAAAALWYRLLMPVNRSVALIGLLIELAGCIVKTFSRVLFIAPLYLLDASASGSPASGAFAGFSPEQLNSIALMFFWVNDAGAATALALFGFSTLLNGYLIFRSGFLPAWLGALAVLSSLGWLAFLYPPLGRSIFMIAALVGLLSLAAMVVWLLVKGVDQEAWRFRAALTQ